MLRGYLDKLGFLRKDVIGNMDRDFGIGLDKLLLVILNIVKFVKLNGGILLEKKLLWRLSKLSWEYNFNIFGMVLFNLLVK